MQRGIGAFVVVAFASLPFHTAGAGSLPEIKTGANNRVPACATPGRMMEYLKSRNPELNSRYTGVATEYMRFGEKLGIRWDYAFYQMIIETGALSYRRGNRAGDVKPAQNNFAGLGATGGGEPGESFKDIPAGVRAHLEHLLLYAGEPVDNPIAERTRKVQEWGVLKDWQARFKRPLTFSDLAAKWAPGSGAYGRMLEAVAERFEEFCEQADPHPEMVADARGEKLKTVTETRAADVRPVAEAKPGPSHGRPSSTDLAQRAINDGKVQESNQRFALGAQASTAPPVAFKMLNSPPPIPPAQAATETPAIEPAGRAVETAARAREPEAKTKTTASVATPKTTPADKQQTKVASAAGGMKPLAGAAAPPGPGQKCRVWTASYGGQKAMIIRSVVDRVVNYTVLDVNEGAEAREAEAFIAAYAKDGAITGEFTSQAQALDKAFELCPEG
ncbi:MAG: hypothetical protein F9K29_21420 [Hyphomicrobiaceae bacterium]|nr:MAG: hypothetical protein F9K29_21420 [Hyphomicrobiaceae bacterium]